MAPKKMPEAKAAVPKVKPDAKPKPKKEKKVEDDRPEDRIPKVDPPDTAAFDAKVQDVQNQIEKLQEKQLDLGKRIKERSGGKDEYHTKRAELRAELDHWTAKLDELRGKKEELQGQFGEKKQEGQQMRNELNKMKKNIGYTSESQIDERIATIEFKLWTESVPLKEEKKMLAEIQELKKNRPKVAGVHKMEASLASDDKGLSLREQSKAIGAEMGTYLEEKRKVSEKLKELNEARKNETGDLPLLIQEREELSNKIRDLSSQRNAIRAERREAEQAYYQYQAEVRKVRQERAAEERTLRQKEYDDRKKQREADKLDEQPYVQEVTLIEQTMAFCKSLVQEKSSEQKEEKKETVHNNPDNTEVLIGKKQRDEEFYYAPTAKGKKSKGKKEAGKDVEKAKPIKHNAETFQLFSKLKLDAPITTADIPELLEKLETQLEDYRTKVKTWEEKREELKRKIMDGETIDEPAEESKKDDEPAEESKKDDGEDAAEEAAKEKTEES